MKKIKATIWLMVLMLYTTLMLVIVWFGIFLRPKTYYKFMGWIVRQTEWQAKEYETIANEFKPKNGRSRRWL